ncbi:MAG TPA: polysaccharide deacetylase family protein [Solirubrobacteraceae bacterium]|nr:polysaccharide deacetylase family protein [Solirubrobacteraceae bacterium]
MPNRERANGCTILDDIWAGEPFSGDAEFLAAVRRTARRFERLGLLTRAEAARILRAAMRSDIGTRDDRSIPNTCPNRVALTFDDGPASYRPQTLAILRERQVPATFFDTGMRVAANPQFPPFESREGHLVLNHTYFHPRLTTLDGAAVRKEVIDTESVLAASGVTMPFKALRAPFLAVDENVLSELAAIGYATVVGADVLSEDWNVATTAAQVRDRTLAGLAAGALVLLHDGPIDSPAGANVVAALPEIIDGARARGFCFGVVDRHGEVAASRLVSGGHAIPGIINPVPYLPLDPNSSGDPPQDPPQPYVIVPSPHAPPQP